MPDTVSPALKMAWVAGLGFACLRVVVVRLASRLAGVLRPATREQRAVAEEGLANVLRDLEAAAVFEIKIDGSLINLHQNH